MSSSFCDKCPRNLKKAPNQACSLALESIEAIQLGVSGVEEKCPWYILSPEYHYCFWLFARDLDVSYTNREIAELLGLSTDAIDKVATAALQKWKDMSGSKIMQDFRESLQDAVARKDESAVFYPERLGEMVNKSLLADIAKEEEDEDNEDVVKKKKYKPKVKVKKKSQKVQMYGLYSESKLKAMRDKK